MIPPSNDHHFLESVTGADLGTLRDEAAVCVTRTFRTARQCIPRREQLLARFAANLEAAAAGETIADAPPLGGLRIGLAVVVAAVRRWFAR